MQYFSTGQKLFEYITKKFTAKETRTKITELILSNQIPCTFVERITTKLFLFSMVLIKVSLRYIFEIKDGTGCVFNCNVHISIRGITNISH